MAQMHKMRPKKPAAAVPAPPHVRGLSPGFLAAAGLALALVVLTYSNHFHNSFHFDDYHTIVANPYIRDLHNTALFFRDARTVDSLPASQTYRPLNAVSFAVDYWLGHGLKPLWFHVSTFLWYLVQLCLMFVVFRRVFDAALPDPRNPWTALFATALYGVHPAMAETVNYIVQRADLYSTLAVLAGLAIYIGAPRQRRFGLFLLPVVVGLFAKQPTAVFPALLFAWIWLFEEENILIAALRSTPSFLVVGPLAYLVLKMAAASFFGGASSAYNYRISQPAVVLSYFRRFFLPLDLSADTDRKPYTSLLDVNVILGILSVLAMCAAALWLRRRRETRPIAFGLFWFLVACAPTSWVPLAEVENDHRLFFPFVGLAMGVSWAAALWLYRHPLPRGAVAGACALLLATAAWGAHQRNIVWHTDESLWLDVTKKSPTNGRGLMNYGLSQMAAGRYTAALDYFTRALVYNPYYSVLEVNLGVVNGALHNGAEAERHFLRAVQLAPKSAEAKMFYGRWLNEAGRVPEAIGTLKEALVDQSDYVEARYMLMQIYAKLGDRENLRALAEETLAMLPSDATSRKWLAKVPTLAPAPAAGARAAPVPAVQAAPQARSVPATPEQNLHPAWSRALLHSGKYAETIAVARETLRLRPGDADAWGALLDAYASMAVPDWNRAVEAGEKAAGPDPLNRLGRRVQAWPRMPAGIPAAAR